MSESRKLVSSSNVDGINLSGTSLFSCNSSISLARALNHFPRHNTYVRILKN
jgi:hypothetical protein